MANINSVARELDELRQMLEIIMTNQLTILEHLQTQPSASKNLLLMHRITFNWLQENRRHPYNLD